MSYDSRQYAVQAAVETLQALEDPAEAAFARLEESARQLSERTGMKVDTALLEVAEEVLRTGALPIYA